MGYLFSLPCNPHPGKNMTVRMRVQSYKSGSYVDMGLKGENTMREIIGSAAGLCA